MALKDDTTNNGMGQDGPNISGIPGITLGLPLWKGGQRSQQWSPADFLQTYGNYTGLFPSLGQQVGQALHGSIQAQQFTPAWAQAIMPPRQNNNQRMSGYYPSLTGPNQPTGSRTLGNPFPLNANVQRDQRQIGYVNHAGNPFVGLYEGLTGWPGNGPPAPPAPPAGPPPGGNPGGAPTGPQPVARPPFGAPTAPPATPSGGYTGPPVYEPRPPQTPLQPQPGGPPGMGGTPFTGNPSIGRPPAAGGVQPPPGGWAPNPYSGPAPTEPLPGSGGPGGGPTMGGNPYAPQAPGSSLNAALQKIMMDPRAMQNLMGMYRGGR